jgi:hypothetical protein
MDVRFTVAIIAILASGADIPGWAPLRPSPSNASNVSSSVFAAAHSGSAEADGTRASGAGPQGTTVHSSDTLQPPSRLLLVRYIDGEFAKLVQSLPAGKHGFKVLVGKPINPQSLRDALRLNGTAATQGDTIQITALEFRPREIVVQINGGGKKHFHWRDHIQFGVGGDTSDTPPPAAGEPEISGATVILDYGRDLPDMSPDDLKRDLSVLFDFSKQHSAAVNWIDTLQPQFQEAIKDRKAIVGMDQEMVIAAIGRPDQKVRERDPDGQETEDWIYGTPPARTVFVTFVADNVIRVKEFN